MSTGRALDLSGFLVLKLASRRAIAFTVVRRRAAAPVLDPCFAYFRIVGPFRQVAGRVNLQHIRAGLVLRFLIIARQGNTLHNLRDGKRYTRTATYDIIPATA